MTRLAIRSTETEARSRCLPPGVRELLLLAALYVGYSAIRTVASDDLGAAVSSATRILDLERLLHLDVERALNDFVHSTGWLEVIASFYYAAAHYLLTPAVVGWLWFRRRKHYYPARTALVAATVAALTIFLLLPTAPPRFLGYHDSLALTADVGWWAESASAPAGLGALTNQLAAMPSMHVGWALWCALVLGRWGRGPLVRSLGWLHAGITVLVVVGTGNHWLLDAVVGGALVLVSWMLLVPPRSTQPVPGES